MSGEAYIICPRCDGQRYDVGSCSLCGNLGALDENGDRFSPELCERCGYFRGPLVCTKCGTLAPRARATP